jgi:hypothetical protein
MLRSAALMTLVLSLLGTGAFAGTAKGVFNLDGTNYTIGSVIAKTDANPFDKTKKDILVLLTDQPVAEADFDTLSLDTLAETGKIHGILVRLESQREVTGLIVLGVVQRSGNFICNFDSTKFSESRVTGKVFLNEPDESFGRKYTFDIEFDTTVKDEEQPDIAEDTGTALPSDGGEPGQAYREYEKAIQSGNPQSLKKYLVPEQGKKLDDPQAGNMLGLMKMMRAQEVRIIKGFLQGDRATLTLEGKDPISNSKTTGTARMRNVEGQWVLERESWSSSFN